MQNWDKYDQQAFAQHELEEHLRRKGLLTRSNPNHTPRCFRCKGTGKAVDKITYEVIGDCPACGGRGFKTPKPKFHDGEIREIIAKLGEQKVTELIKRYGQRKRS